MKYFFPVMIGYFSYSLPLGLSLYWNIFSIFSIIQHMHLNRGKKEAVVSSKEITTPTKTK
jgi:YidC/Oxa1 family membrane protein insertase